MQHKTRLIVRPTILTFSTIATMECFSYLRHVIEPYKKTLHCSKSNQEGHVLNEYEEQYGDTQQLYRTSDWVRHGK